MFSSPPYPPTVMWSTTNTGTTIPSGVLPTGTISTPQQCTPNDVANYLGRMDFSRSHVNHLGDVWKHKDMNGYMTWEQAVAYCLVKPWLVEDSNA